jgi:hypothetical protein
MNRVPLDQPPCSLIAGLVIAFEHALGLAFIGLLGVMLWVRVIAPVFGLNDRVLHIDGWLVAALVLAYAGFLIIRNRRNKIV